MSDAISRIRAADAKCFDCGLGEETLLAVQAYLLKQLVMPASTIPELVEASKCFDCGLGRETLEAIIAYLLNEMVAGGGGGGGGGGIFKRRLSGHGEPNGVVIGYIDEDYVDLDTGIIWWKYGDDGLSSGWGL